MIDLNAARKARADKAGEPHEVKLGDDKFTIPRTADWPAEAMEVLAQGQVWSAARLIVGDDFDRFAAQGITLGDVTVLFEGVTEAEGIKGNSPASRRS